jgi:hypothetical protein
VLAVRADGSDARREKRAADPCRAISVRKATPDRYPPAGQPGGHPRLWLHLGPNYLGEKFRLRVYRVGDSPAPPLGTDDPELLEWAEQESCILVSCDRQTMAGYFWDHLGAGRHAPGLILLPNVFSVADVLEYLILAVYATAPEEWQDRMIYY